MKHFNTSKMNAKTNIGISWTKGKQWNDIPNSRVIPDQWRNYCCVDNIDSTMHSSGGGSGGSRYRYPSSSQSTVGFNCLTYILSLMANWKVMLPLIILVWFIFFSAVMSDHPHHLHHSNTISNTDGSYTGNVKSLSLRGIGSSSSSATTSTSSISRTSLRSIASAATAAQQLQQQQKLPQHASSSSSSSNINSMLTTNGRVSNTDHNNRAKLNRRMSSSQYNHLIVVAGHAVMRLNHLLDADKSDEGWYLLDYQKGQGYPSIITSHIQTGIKLANQDSSAILLFSGGQTRKDVGPLSEAASYYYLAEEKQWIVSTDNEKTASAAEGVAYQSLRNRVFLEEYARDSFENLLFSICRYYELTNMYPQHITMIGFDFKRQRFTDLHRMAIQYPYSNFTYVGIQSPQNMFDQQRAEHGEEIVLNEFRQDLYGCHNDELAHKRISRNPFHRTIPYELACPDMRELLDWCGPHVIDSKHIPWGHEVV